MTQDDPPLSPKSTTPRPTDIESASAESASAESTFVSAWSDPSTKAAMRSRRRQIFGRFVLGAAIVFGGQAVERRIDNDFLQAFVLALMAVGLLTFLIAVWARIHTTRTWLILARNEWIPCTAKTTVVGSGSTRLLTAVRLSDLGLPTDGANDDQTYRDQTDRDQEDRDQEEDEQPGKDPVPRLVHPQRSAGALEHGSTTKMFYAGNINRTIVITPSDRSTVMHTHKLRTKWLRRQVFGTDIDE